MSDREVGWYWCHAKFQTADRWEVAYWTGEEWEVTMREYGLSDEDAGFVEFVGPLMQPGEIRGVLTAETVTDDQIRALERRMGVSETDRVIKEQCVIALASYMDQARARAWVADYLNAEASRTAERCASCHHPAHRGICTGRSGGTAYKCGCTCQETKRGWPFPPLGGL